LRRTSPPLDVRFVPIGDMATESLEDRMLHCEAHTSLAFSETSALGTDLIAPRIGMQRGHDLRAFADGRSNALDGFRADISDGEDAMPIGLQYMAIAARILAGHHEPLGIERDIRAGKPICIRISTDEQK
jgi:hypothetical protein